jgi:two-component system nitrogen regulation sensor histidine kinase NtrY
MPTGLSTGLSTGLPEALPMGHPTSLPVGHITLRLRAEPDQVVIMVEDDGIGLPPGEERERLTEPYVTHKAKGTGLGLAIVKKIMEDHGGRLVLEDRGEGVDGAGGENAGGGARAALVLPWRAAPGILPDRPAAPPRPDAEEMRRAHGA